MDNRDEITSLVTMLIGYAGGILTAEMLCQSHGWAIFPCAVGTSTLAVVWWLWRKRT